MTAQAKAGAENGGSAGAVPALAAQAVHAAYGASRVLHGISLEVGEGETVCLLGRNGAGKTTTLRTVIGILPPRSGSVRLFGAEVAGWPAHRIARHGVGYVPEDRRIFPTLTLRENLELALAARRGREGPDVDAVLGLFPKLRELEASLGGNLSGGEQQMLTVARALMTAPRLLLLDEPTEGLAPVVVEDLQRGLREVVGSGMTVLIAEQRVEFVLDLADRAYIIDRGEIRFAGSVEEVRADEQLLERYLGVG